MKHPTYIPIPVFSRSVVPISALPVSVASVTSSVVDSGTA